ncbi:MAG: O-antigen ligase family protein [Acidimicrobiia bacterium]|nr:O-antigen ligase family protein [Acidimicrobiia bacterium]
MRFGMIAAAALLAVDPWGWDRFGPLRWALLSTLCFAAIAISLGSGDVRLRPLPRWAVLGWVITLAGLALSTALSEDLWHSLIGTPDRHLGLAAWVMFAGLFATASIYPKTASPIVLRATTIATSLGGVYTLLEVGQVGSFASDFAGDRAGGTFGQPAFLGAAMVLAVPLCAAVAVDKVAPLAWRVAGVLGSILGASALALSQSRAAWVGIAVATISLVVRRRTWILGVMGLLFIVGLLATTSLGDRAATLTEFDTGVVVGRLDEWQVGVDALFESPTRGVLGYGPEGYRTVFGAHVDERYVIQHGRDVITDRAHLGLLDTSLSGGLVTGAGMVLLQLGLLVTAMQRLRADDPTDAALGVAVIGYVTQQFFLFPLAELDPVFWVLAGLLVARRPQRGELRPPLFTSVSGAKEATMLVAGFFAAVCAVAGLSDVAADHAVNGVIDAPDGNVALAAADIARNRRPDSIRYDFIAARAAAGPGTLDGYREALLRLEAGLATSPRDPAFLAERGIVLLEIARRDGSEEALNAALDSLEDLDTSDPNNPATELTHGIALALAGRSDAAIAELEHAARLDPVAIEPHLNLAVVHFERGDLSAGARALDEVDARAPSNAQAQTLRREFLS